MIKNSRSGFLKGTFLSLALGLSTLPAYGKSLSTLPGVSDGIVASGAHPAHIDTISRDLESVLETPSQFLTHEQENFTKLHNVEPDLSWNTDDLTPVGTVEYVSEVHHDETIKVGGWNLEIFGQTKAFGPRHKPDDRRRKLIADEIKDYDIVLLTEVRDSRGTAIQALCDDLPGYNCWASSRAGGRHHKEQVVVAARNYIPLIGAHDYNPNPSFVRPPVRATFRVPTQYGAYDATFLTSHLDPDNVEDEILELEQLANLINPNENVVVLGDMNYDCDYAKPHEVGAFTRWLSVIPDSADTTTSATDCAYDRVFLSEGARDEYVAPLNEVPHPGLGPKQSERLSNHHIVGAVLRLPKYEFAQMSTIGLPKIASAPSVTPFYVVETKID